MNSEKKKYKNNLDFRPELSREGFLRARMSSFKTPKIIS